MKRVRFLPPWIETPFFSTVFFLPFLWIPAGYIANGNDTSYPWYPWRFVYNRIFAWNPVPNGGTDYSDDVGTAIWHAVQGVFYNLGFDHTNIERASLGVWILLCTFAVLFCLKIVTGRPVAAYMGTLLYVLNPFVFSGAVWQNTSAANIALYFALPALTGSFFLMRRGGLAFVSGASVFGLATFLASPMGNGPPMQIAFFAGALTVLLFELLRLHSKKERIALVKVAAVALCVYILVSLYWIVPLYEYLSNQYSQTASFSLAASNIQDWLIPAGLNTSLFNVARLLGAWDWFQSFNGAPMVSNAPLYISAPLMILVGTGLSILCYASVVLANTRRLKRAAVLGAILALLGSVLAAGAHGPTGALYLFLADFIPGMQVERSPWYMFETITLFGYAIMFGISVDAAVERFWGWRLTAIGLSLALVLIYAWPMFTFSFFEPFRQNLPGFLVSYPRYVIQAAQFLDTRPGRYLTLPFQGGSIFYWTNGSWGSGDPLTSFITSRSAAYAYPNVSGTSAKPFDAMLRRCINDILSENTAVYGELQSLGITDIVLQDDAWYDWNGPGVPPSVWHESVERIPGIRRTADFGPWHIYSIPYAGEVQSGKSLVVSTMRHDEVGVWRDMSAGKNVILASDPTYSATLGSTSPLTRGIVDEPSATTPRLSEFLKLSFPAARLSTLLTSNSVHPTRDLIIRGARARLRQREQPLLTFAQWSERGPRAISTEAPPSVGTFSFDDVSLTSVHNADNSDQLIVDNLSDGPAQVTIALPSGSQPDTSGADVLSWDPADSLLTLRVPLGQTIEQVQVPAGAADPTLLSISENRTPAIFARRVRVVQTRGGVIIVTISAAQSGSSGVFLPLLQNLPMDVLPVLTADVRTDQPRGTRIGVAAQLVDKNGTPIVFEAPLQNGQVALASLIDSRFRAQWDVNRLAHIGDVHWLLSHRLPERSSRFLIKKLGLLLEATASGDPGGRQVSFDVRNLSVDAEASYAPIRGIQSLEIGPAQAHWSGFAFAAQPNFFTLPDATIVPPQPLSTFSDFEPGIVLALHRDERYLFSIEGQSSFEAQVLDLTGDRVALQMDDGSVRQVLRTALSSLAEPSFGGIVQISRAAEGSRSAGKTFGVSYSIDPRQRIVITFLFVGRGRSYTVRVSPDDINFIRQGGRVLESPSLALFENTQALTEKGTGALSIENTPPGKRLLIELAPLLAQYGLSADLILRNVQFEITNASLGFSIGRAELIGGAVAIKKAAPLRSSEITETLAGAGPVAPNVVSMRLRSKRINPTRYEVQLSSAYPRVLTLDQSYDRGWLATIEPQGRQSYLDLVRDFLSHATLPHFRVDGYRNGWIVPPGRNMQIVIFYSPQLLLVASGLVSLAALVACVIILACTVTIYATRPK